MHRAHLFSRRPLASRAFLAPLLAAALAACGPNGAAPKPCGTGQVICGTICVDLSNDAENCGLCGNACAAPANGGQTACVRGTCAPTCSGGGLALCDAAPGADGGLQLSCTDTNLDPNNCGACGTQCGPNQNCDNGVCTGCPSGMLRCPGATGMPPICLAILSDNANCGGCGTACASGTYCDNGACIPTGDTNCGNADGGQASSANLTSDRYNCGVCGNACADSETCTNSRCEPCPIAQCNNACTDTANDPANCGGCAVACTGGKACIQGACAAQVSVEMLGPADGGFINNVNYSFQYAQVESELPIAQVYFSGPVFGQLADGGPITRVQGQVAGAGASNQITLWGVELPPQNPDAGWNGVVTATAYDQAWSTASATTQAQHQGSASALIHYAGAIDGGYVPSLSITSGGTLLSQGAFIPLGAGEVVISVQAPPLTANIGYVQFVMQGTNNTLVLGNGQQSGGSIVVQALPTELILGNSTIYAYAYGQDGAYEGSGAPFNLTIGSLETAVNTPALTVDVDAGTSNLWWLKDDAGVGTLQTTPWNKVLAAGFPDAGASDAGYYEDTLLPSINPSTVFAITTSGAVDRFPCASGFGCYQHSYVSGISARYIIAETKLGLALTDTAGRLWFAPAAGGAAVQAGGYLYMGPMLTDSGAIFAVISSQNNTARQTVTATPYQIVVYTPSAGVQLLGDAMPQPPNLNVFPSGEVVWSWNSADNASGTLRAAFYDGTAFHLTNALGVGPANGGGQAVIVARPGVMLGATSAATSVDEADGGVGPAQSALFVADTTAGTLRLPIQAAHPQTGPLMISQQEGGGSNTGVGARDGQLHSWTVSDDQLKALAVTQDPTTAADGTVTQTYTLWMIDLVASTAYAVYQTPNLLPFAVASSGCNGPVSPAMAPHFVHTASGTINTVWGGQPSSTIAAVPGIVFSEKLDDSQRSGSTFPARLYSSKYTPSGPSSAPASVDRFALLELCATSLALESQNATLAANIPYERETPANGGAFVFIATGAGGDQSLFASPLFASSGNTITSTRILDNAVDFRTREDTGRILALRGDGNLYSGLLGPSPSMSVVLTGGSGGTPSLYFGANVSFGFTSDGTHAYLAEQVGGQGEDWNGGNLVNAVLEEVDLASGARTDYGTLTYGNANLVLPAFFLHGGATAFGVSAPSIGVGTGSQSLDFWGAMSPPGTHHYDSGISYVVFDGFSNYSSPMVSWELLSNVELSLDGTEGRATLGANYFPSQINGRIPHAGVSPDEVSFSPSGPPHTVFVAQDGTLYGQTLFADQQYLTEFYAQPASYSPFGGPYAPDYEVYGSQNVQQLRFVVPSVVHPDGVPTTSNTSQVLFKRWGAPGGPQKPLLLATGGYDYNGAAVTADQSLLIMLVQSNDGKLAPTEVTMPAHPAPKQPLP